MAEQIKNLIAKWDATWPSPLVVSRQHDNGQFRINLVDYPEPENYENQNEEILETINYYLVVWMKQSEDGEMEKLAPIQLPGPYWLVNSPYTQLVQDIKFQFYATSSVTGYIAHSAQFKGMILESLSGSQQQSVIPEDMWDAYKQYIEDKIIGAGLATIDPTLSISGAAADAKATGDAIAGVNGRLQELNGLQTVVTGTGRGIGGYSYECEFVPGQKYVITNTSDSIRFNAKTWNDGADVEKIKNAIMPGESVTFVPTLAAPYLRLYFSDAGMGSFEVKSGEITEMKDTVEALGTTVSGLTANVETLSANVEKMQYSESVEYESGLYSGPVPAVGDTYDKAKTSNTGWICKKVPVTQGDRVIFYGAATASTPLWVYTTTGGTVIAVTSAIQYTSENPVELDITDDGFLYLNARTTYGYGATHYINDGYGKIEEQIEALREEIPVIIPPYPLEFTFDVTGIPAQDNFSITSHDPQDIYDLYDGLMTTYPAYITRVDCSEADSILGVTRPSYLADYPIYLYKFSPKVINTTAAIKRKIKMMVLTGLHSNEKWNVYNVYRIMKYICENWKTDKNAATIRTFVEFWIIPMVNPWGWANAGTGSAGRVNGNGVNLNRNAPASTWRQTSEGSDYSGPSAGSEYETKIWLYYHDQLQPDVFIDQHTPGMPSTGYFGVLEADITNTAIANIGDVMCREISNHLLKVDENVPDSADTVLFDLYSDTNPGQASRCALEHGTPYAFLFEMADSSKWSNGVLTESTVTGASSGIQIREQMQNIYGCWQRLLSAASK